VFNSHDVRLNTTLLSTRLCSNPTTRDLTWRSYQHDWVQLPRRAKYFASRLTKCKLWDQFLVVNDVLYNLWPLPPPKLRLHGGTHIVVWDHDSWPHCSINNEIKISTTTACRTPSSIKKTVDNSHLLDYVLIKKFKNYTHLSRRNCHIFHSVSQLHCKTMPDVQTTQYNELGCRASDWIELNLPLSKQKVIVYKSLSRQRIALHWQLNLQQLKQ